MSIATLKFNDVSSEAGYGVSSAAKGLSSRDISDMHIGEEIGYVSSSFASNDPIFDNNQQSFTESLIEGNTRTETLMETMRPDKDYKAPDIDAKSMIRSADKVVTDGAQISRQANLGMEAVQETIADFQADWKQAKEECFNALIDSSKDMGIDPSAAVDSLIPDSKPTKATAMAYVGLEVAAIGAGTVAAMGKGAFVTSELGKEDKKLPKEQQEALLKETLERLQSSSASNQDTRANPMSGSAAPEDSSKESEIAWENMKIEDLAELMLADSDGLDQPEMQDLLQMEHDLNVVLDNHEYVKEHYADTPTMEKMFNSAETGNDTMNKILFDAQIVQTDFGSDSVVLTGASLDGIEVMASDIGFDSKTVETFMDMNKIPIPEVQRQLDADIRSQMSFG